MKVLRLNIFSLTFQHSDRHFTLGTSIFLIVNDPRWSIRRNPSPRLGFVNGDGWWWRFYMKTKKLQKMYEWMNGGLFNGKSWQFFIWVDCVHIAFSKPVLETDAGDTIFNLSRDVLIWTRAQDYSWDYYNFQPPCPHPHWRPFFYSEFGLASHAFFRPGILFHDPWLQADFALQSSPSPCQINKYSCCKFGKKTDFFWSDVLWARVFLRSAFMNGMTVDVRWH